MKLSKCDMYLRLQTDFYVRKILEKNTKRPTTSVPKKKKEKNKNR